MAPPFPEIPPQAYEVTEEALSLSCWFKESLRQRLEQTFREHPEILDGVDFGQSKRHIAKEIVGRLARRPAHDVLMLEIIAAVSCWEPHHELRRQQDGTELDQRARAALAAVRKVAAKLANDPKGTRSPRNTRPALSRPESVPAPHGDGLEEFRARLARLALHQNPTQRGLLFQDVIYDFAASQGLSPRRPYPLKGEELDGSILLDHRALPLEIKWWAGALEREHGDIFAAKLARKGSGTRGIFISWSGFSKGFKDHYPRGSSFVTCDGNDLRLIAEGRMNLQEALRLKLRFLEETGNCWRPVQDILGEL